jgi:hypothetical protein
MSSRSKRGASATAVAAGSVTSASKRGKRKSVDESTVDTDAIASNLESQSPAKKAKNGGDESAADASTMADTSAPSAPGSKKGKGKGKAAAASLPDPVIPTTAVDFTGKKFIVMGGFQRGKYRIESAITDGGGVITKAAAKSVSYVVCGEPVSTDYGGVSGPGSKVHRECKKLKIPVRITQRANKIKRTNIS